MDKIYPKKNKLIKRLAHLKTKIHTKNDELDKKARELSLLEKEAILVQRMLELDAAITAETTKSTEGSVH